MKFIVANALNCIFTLINFSRQRFQTEAVTVKIKQAEGIVISRPTPDTILKKKSALEIIWKYLLQRCPRYFFVCFFEISNTY